MRPGFEGGQTPIYRRLPKQGFFHLSKEFKVINLARLEKDSRVLTGQTLDFSQAKKPVKILGAGELSKSLTILASAFSQTAQKKIAQAGGKSQVVSQK